MISDIDFFNDLDLLPIDQMISENSVPHALDEDVAALEPILESEVMSLSRRYHLPIHDEVKGSIWEVHNHPKVIHSIKSMVGDDEVVTTNDLIYSAAIIVVGPLISRVKISWSDVQFSRNMFNYAEGWILLPPSIDSSFEAVNKYNRGNGVPFVLDNIKFKNLSPVRKQSDMNVDLASKFRNLSEAASWTDPDWFTYDMHQFALLIGIETFDFVKSKQFPFLFKWEGGCGGAPPWNNLLTAAGAVFRYRRGRAQRGILGIMEDTNLLITGNRKPNDCWFARHLNLAMSNDERWARVTSELEWRTSEAHAAGLEPVPLEREVADKQLPVELVAKSATVYPDDPLTGVAISHLREKGFLLTETDLIGKHNAWLRTMAVWGDTPMREIENQLSIRREEYREAYLERLDVMTRQDHKIPAVYGKLFSIQSPFEIESLAIMASYYRMRVEQDSIFTSFMYDDNIRVFKTSDVRAYYNRDSKSIRDQFSKDCQSRYRPDYARSIHLPNERQKISSIEKWIDSKPLDELLSEPLPPGIGPDDARISRDARMSLELDSESYDGLLYLLITDDQKLTQGVQALLNSDSRAKNVEVRVVGLRTNDFIRWCLTPSIRKQKREFGFEWVQGFIPNPYNDRIEKPVDGPLLDSLMKEGRFLYRRSTKRMRIFYDYPNINRKLKRFWPDPECNGVKEFSGGFLRRSTLQAVTGLAALSLEKISRMPDFNYNEKSKRGPFKLKESLKLYSAMRGIEINSPWR